MLNLFRSYYLLPFSAFKIAHVFDEITVFRQKKANNSNNIVYHISKYRWYIVFQQFLVRNKISSVLHLSV